MAKSADLERVEIRWHVVPNADTLRGGWMPVYDLDGKQRGSTYGKGYDLETALQMAKDDAEQEASRYTGDWDVSVEQKLGTHGAPKTKRKAAKPKAPPEPSSPWGKMGTASDTLPWRNSYANWTIRAGEAAAKYNRKIAYGSETYSAWEAGVSPDDYARSQPTATYPGTRGRR